VFGQAVLFDHLKSGPLVVEVWLITELAITAGIAAVVEGRLGKRLGPCWLRALIAVGAIQIGLYGLGAVDGE
jgi:hypothetical protein